MPVATLSIVLAQISLPGLSQEGPDDLQRMLSVFYAMLGAGFLLGIAGHILKARLLVIAGVALVFAGTGVFVLAISSYG